MSIDWQTAGAYVGGTFTLVASVLGWLVRRQALIRQYTTLVFQAVDSLYPPGRKPDGVNKSEVAVGKLLDALGTHKMAVTANELARVKLQWEAMHGQNRMQILAATVPALLQDVKAPALQELPAPVVAQVPSKDELVAAVLAALPPTTGPDEEAIARRVLGRLAGALGAAPADAPPVPTP